jgi:hypothetical protein
MVILVNRTKPSSTNNEAAEVVTAVLQTIIPYEMLYLTHKAADYLICRKSAFWAEVCPVQLEPRNKGNQHYKKLLPLKMITKRLTVLPRC